MKSIDQHLTEIAGPEAGQAALELKRADMVKLLRKLDTIANSDLVKQHPNLRRALEAAARIDAVGISALLDQLMGMTRSELGRSSAYTHQIGGQTPAAESHETPVAESHEVGLASIEVSEGAIQTFEKPETSTEPNSATKFGSWITSKESPE